MRSDVGKERSWNTLRRRQIKGGKIPTTTGGGE
jgi:hypothetical protein